GSWCFLATIITTAPLAPDSPLTNRCGSCRACIEACPTHAITEEQTMDARRCISYHSIENRDEIPEDIADKMGDCLFGCDICQSVCPWNQNKKCEDAASPTHPEFAALDPAMLTTLSDEDFHRLFDGTPVTRAKAKGIRRNASLFLRNHIIPPDDS
ncbi:MAG: 4Fe-4S dicluster domain-containing protein, partial [Candidatus Hydrogenedentes bacterium]|nr:4Fe-4S dicluster domain-containing protein [Candidatus Hydrogenedentota bacterium]